MRREGEQLVLSPLSIVTDRVIAIDLEDPGGVRELSTDNLVPPVDPVHEALVEARDHLDAGAHAGLRRVTGAWREALAKHGVRLEQIGLRSCAVRVQSCVERLAGRHDGDIEATDASTFTTDVSSSLG